MNFRASDVVTALDRDEFSADELEAVALACNAARNRVRNASLKQFSEGDTVLITTGRKTTRGKYPPVLTGIVQKVGRTRAHVDCGDFGVHYVEVTRMSYPADVVDDAVEADESASDEAATA